MYNTYKYTSNFCNPKAFISVKHNRIKVYPDNKLYLNDGDEFEIEFQNDGDYYVKADIVINGKTQNSALVLSPGERFYLDRFMDEKKKLKFNVFKTGNDDIEELKKILERNGRIEIKFYKEYISQSWTTVTYSAFNDSIPFYPDMDVKYMSSDTLRSSVSKGLINDSVHINAFACMSNLNEEKEVETGRIEAGKKSNQDFVPTDRQFQIFPVVTVVYHILPKSQKPREEVYIKKKSYIVADDKEFRAYCNGCGRRVKSGWQFCPGCGQKH